jgi:hypothetical protein
MTTRNQRVWFERIDVATMSVAICLDCDGEPRLSAVLSVFKP